MDYKEKLEEAKRLYESANADQRYVLESLFPELKESEDDRIRKEIIKYLEQTVPHHHRDEVLKSKEWIAWLEKQNSNVDNANKEYCRGYREGKQEILDKYAELEKQDKEKPAEEYNITGISSNKSQGKLGEIIKNLKTTWSEEDEKMIRALLSICDIYSTKTSFYPKENEDIEKLKNWLKSLKPQNKYVYNPYKAVVESIAEMCKHYDKASHSGLRDFYDNVKIKCKDAKEYDSLYPQNTWKPSDEQMEALFIKIIGESGYDDNTKLLYSLLSDLKKLREE